MLCVLCGIRNAMLKKSSLKLTTSFWEGKLLLDGFRQSAPHLPQLKASASGLRLSLFSCAPSLVILIIEPGQKKVILLQKAFHTLKPVNPETCELSSWRDSLMHYLVSLADDQSKGYLAKMKVTQGVEGNSDSKSTLLFGIIPHRIIWPAYKRLKRHFQQWHTMVKRLGFF